MEREEGGPRWLRLFCLAPSGARVRGEPRSRRGRAQGGKPAAAGGGASTLPPACSPSAAEALRLYLGSWPARDAPEAPSADHSSVLQSSAFDSSSCTSSSTARDRGYDADSDCPLSESSPARSGARRFRPAVRHAKDEAAAGPAAAGPAAAEPDAEAGGVGELVERFECLSVSSSGGNSARRHAGAAAPQAAPATAGCHTTELTRFMLEEAPQPGTSSSSSRASGALSLAASGSVSLAHFLGGAPASASTSRSSSMPRCVRRVGSTQLVLADGEASPTVANAEAGGDGAAVPAAAEPAAPPVQRRLSEIQSGHYISLDKLQSQCGDFQETPGDLLSLMARRVFASRGSLLQRLCSKGQLSDLQADDSRLQTASPHVPSLASPRPPAQPAQPDQQQLAALAEEAPAEPALPQLRPIRTRVGQARSRAQASGSEVGSTAGGGTPASAQGSQG